MVAPCQIFESYPHDFLAAHSQTIGKHQRAERHFLLPCQARLPPTQRLTNTDIIVRADDIGADPFATTAFVIFENTRERDIRRAVADLQETMKQPQAVDHRDISCIVNGDMMPLLVISSKPVVAASELFFILLQGIATATDGKKRFRNGGQVVIDSRRMV